MIRPGSMMRADMLLAILFLVSTICGCAASARKLCTASIIHKKEGFSLVGSAIGGGCFNVQGGNGIKASGLKIKAGSMYEFVIKSDSPLYVYGFNLLIAGERGDYNSGEIKVKTYFYASDGDIFPLGYTFVSKAVGKKVFPYKVYFEQMANTVLPGKVIEVSVENNNSVDVDIVGIEIDFSENINYTPKASADSVIKYFKYRKSDFDDSMIFDLIYYSISDASMKNVFLNLSSSHADEGEYISFLKSAFLGNFK